jgi:hypothetical protein
MRKTPLLVAVLLGLSSLGLAETRPVASAGQEFKFGSQFTPHASTIIVPAETEAKIQLLSGIHSGISHVGDPFAAELVSPISVDGQVVLPAGSLIEGRISFIRPAGRMRRAAELGLRFELVTLPDGKDQPISALLTELQAKPRTHTMIDSEGILKGTNSGTWKRLTFGLLGVGAASAIGTQIAGTAALGLTLPVGGGAMLGSFLIPKGHEVHVPPDTQMSIRLRQPLTVRVDW